MERFKFKNAYGASVVIDYDGPNVLTGYEGLGVVEVVPRTVAGTQQIGYTLESVALGARIITITYLVEASNLVSAYANRAAISAAFNPLAGEGVLTYENDAVKRSITCSVTAPPDPIERNGVLNEYSVQLTAQNPLFYDPIETARLVQDFVGGLRFPIRFNPTIHFARRGDALSPVIIGDVPSPIRVEFRGGCTNPHITNVTTGEQLKIGNADEIITLQDDERLVVCTEYGNKTASLIRADGEIVTVDDYVDDDSTFFSLPIGQSRITFAADAGSPQAYIYYRNWYTSGA